MRNAKDAIEAHGLMAATNRRAAASDGLAENQPYAAGTRRAFGTE